MFDLCRFSAAGHVKSKEVFIHVFRNVSGGVDPVKCCGTVNWVKHKKQTRSV